jgi:hypothetical protein
LDQLSHAGADSADIVYSVRNRKTNQRYACKRISKHQLDYAGSCMRSDPDTHLSGLHAHVHAAQTALVFSERLAALCS